MLSLAVCFNTIYFEAGFIVMRKQYHFRKVENDTYIWDVDNLVAFTQHFKVKEIPLSDIKELEEAYWYPDTHPTTQDILEHMQ